MTDTAAMVVATRADDTRQELGPVRQPGLQLAPDTIATARSLPSWSDPTPPEQIRPMLTHPTHPSLERLKTQGLCAMAAALEGQQRAHGIDPFIFRERLGVLLDREATSHAGRRLEGCSTERDSVRAPTATTAATVAYASSTSSSSPKLANGTVIRSVATPVARASRRYAPLAMRTCWRGSTLRYRCRHVGRHRRR